MTLSEEKNLNDQTDNNLDIQVMDESAKNQDFFQDNNATVGTRYTTTRIKSRNFLSIIAYVGINKEEYYNKNFIFDVYLLVTKNLNLFLLDRQKQARDDLHALEGVHACEILQVYLQRKIFFLSQR